jgi:hypothetical protein
MSCCKEGGRRSPPSEGGKSAFEACFYVWLNVSSRIFIILFSEKNESQATGLKIKWIIVSCEPIGR